MLPRLSKRSTCGGFSMVEMLVTIATASILMTAVTQFFAFQLASMRVERARRSAQMTARTALAFIARQLEHVGRDPQRTLFSHIDNTALPPAITAADGESIHYLTNLSQDSTDDDTVDAWEDVTFTNDDGVIWVTQGAGDPASLTDETTANSHVPEDGLTFAYFDAAGDPVVDLSDDAALASIRRIAVSLTVMGGAAPGDEQSPRITLSQDVFLRNPS